MTASLTTVTEGDELQSIFRTLLDPRFYQEQVANQNLEPIALQSFLKNLFQKNGNEISPLARVKLSLLGELAGELELPVSLCRLVLLDPLSTAVTLDGVIAQYWEEWNGNTNTRVHAVTIFEERPALVISTLAKSGYFKNRLPPALEPKLTGILQTLDEKLNLLKTPLTPDASMFIGLSEEEKSDALLFLGAIQQVCQTIIQPTDLPALMVLGFSSVEDIAYCPFGTFISLVSSHGIDMDHARKIHTQAKRLQGMAEQTILSLMLGDPTQDLRRQEPGILYASAPTVGSGSTSSYPDTPARNNVGSWFGDLDDMGCPDCCSVTSPAAYFVDLLRFLKTTPASASAQTIKPDLPHNPPSNSLLARLFMRRPDLGDLLLSCRNTSERVPYIDLVNETLESAVLSLDGKDDVSSGIDIKSYNADNAVLFSHDAVLSSAAKKQVPRDSTNVNFAVYDQITSQLVFPSSVFPYDYSQDAIYGYLAASGVTLSEVVNTFQVLPWNSDVSSGHQREAALRLHASIVLNLVEGDFVALAEESFHSLEAARFSSGDSSLSVEDYQSKIGLQPSWYYWGYKDNNPDEADGVVSMLQTEEDLDSGSEKTGLTFIKDQLLPRLGESYATLVALLKTRFMMRSVVIQPFRSASAPVVSNQLGDFRLCAADGGPLSSFTLQRLEQLVRLWRRLQKKGKKAQKQSSGNGSWTLDDVDDALCMFGEPPKPKSMLASALAEDSRVITPQTIKAIANVVELVKLSGRAPGQILGMFSQTATYFRRLPIVKAMALADGEKAVSTSSQWLPLLIASLDLSYGELMQMLAEEQVSPEEQMDLGNIHLFYRLSTLCKLMKVSYLQLSSLLAVLSNEGAAAQLSSPGSLLALLQQWQRMVQYGWTAETVIAVAGDSIQKVPGMAIPNNKSSAAFATLLSLAIKDPRDAVSSPLFDQALLQVICGLDKSVSVELANTLLDIRATALPLSGTDGSTTIRNALKALVQQTTQRRATLQGVDVDGSSLFFISDTAISIKAIVSPGAETPKSLDFASGHSCPLIPTSETNLTTNTTNVHGTMNILTSGFLSALDIKWPATLSHVELSFDEISQNDTQSAGQPVVPPFVALREVNAQMSRLIDQILFYILLAQQYKISHQEISVLSQHLLDPRGHRGAILMRAHQYGRARKVLASPDKELNFSKLVSWFCTTDSPLKSLSEASSRFTKASKVSQALAEQLLIQYATLGPLPKSVADRLLFLCKLSDQVQLLTTIRLKEDSVPSLFLISKPLPFGHDREESIRLRTVLLQHLKAALTAREAYESLANVQDDLRNHRRLALVHHLLHHPAMKAWGVEDEGGLFEFFLIDVSMSSVLATTRVQQAIATVQLFVHRCLLGREKHIDAGLISRDRWSWMQRLSTWEANRRVFLYPESYVDPTVRENKTEIFKSVVEDVAMQNSLDDTNLHKILRSYAYAAEDVSSLRVEAIHYEAEQEDLKGVLVDSNQGKGIYHFFGRTRNAPYSYYYRSMEHTSRGAAVPSPVWAPWTKIPFDITSHDVDGDGAALDRPGCYLVPAVFKKRLLVFMPKLTVRKNVQQEGSGQGTMTIQPSADGKTSNVKTNNSMELSVEIKLAWTELIDSVFVGRKESGIALNVPSGASGKVPAYDSFQFLARAVDDTISVLVYQQEPSGSDSNKNATAVVLDRKCLGQFVLYGPTVKFETADMMGFTPRLAGAKYPKARFGTLSWPTNSSATGEGNLTNLTSSIVRPGDWPKVPDSKSEIVTWTLNSKYGTEMGLIAESTSTPARGPESWFLLASTHNFTPLYNTIVQDLRRALSEDSGIDKLYRIMDEAELSNRDHAWAFGNSESLAQCREDSTPHGLYNWEIGFHTVALLAERLISLQQFDKALEYARLVFDATGSNAEKPKTATEIEKWRPAWRFPPFRDAATRKHGTIDSLLSSLKPSSGAEDKMESRILAWRKSPFRPHVVARNRPLAYMKRFVMKYIEALVASGDVLFSQNSLELLPLAIQKYSEAFHVLGPAPEKVAGLHENKVIRSYNDLALVIDDFSNATVAMRLTFPYFVPLQERGRVAADNVGDLEGLQRTRYFGIQANNDFVKLRELVVDRLYKIRNSLDINGSPRTLALWDPPIDPMALVNAVAAAGGNLQSALQGGANGIAPSYSAQVVPRKRFMFLLTRAFELCTELKVSSSNLLAAIEKKDSEALQMLRCRQDSALQRVILEMKTHQKSEAELGLELLNQQRRSAVHRLEYYAALTGDGGSDLAPKPDTDFNAVTQTVFKPVNDDLRLNGFEAMEMSFADAARTSNSLAADEDYTAALYFMLPMPCLNAQFMGLGISESLPNLGQANQQMAGVLRARALDQSEGSARAGRIAGWIRQLQERRLQLNLAGFEINGIDQQIKSQRARIAAVDADIHAQQLSAESSAETLNFFVEKFSGEKLYAWMEAGLRQTLYQTYLLAKELAHKVEAAYVFECGPDSSGLNGSGARSGPFISAAGYLDNSRNGLLAGEQLWLSLKQLELAYLSKDDNHSVFNILKNISLRQLDPRALLDLRENGDATFHLPEVLFDLEFPGHYFRRIKSVTFSIHAIVGPYTSINCTATLVDHKYRFSAATSSSGSGYPEKDSTSDGRRRDERFAGQDIKLPISAVALGVGQQDTGVFDLSFGGGEEYQPFEGAGAISTWNLRLPDTIRQFDYRSISDVVLNLRFTSRDGGEQLRAAASSAVKDGINALAAATGSGLGLSLLIDIRQDVPDVWHNLRMQWSNIAGSANATATTTAKLQVLNMQSIMDRLPYYVRAAGGILVMGLTLFIAAEDGKSVGSKVPRILRSQGKHDAHDEIKFQYSEPYGTMHKFVAEVGNGVVSGDVNMVKDGSWCLDLGTAVNEAFMPADIMLLINYSLAIQCSY